MIAQELPPWLVDRLCCPTHRLRLTRADGALHCPQGERFPIVDGVPVLLRADVAHTRPHIAERSLQLERFPIHDDVDPNHEGIDPYVTQVLVGSSGNLYHHMASDGAYPIPALRFAPFAAGDILLDVGCHWGRWSLAAGRAGFRPIGIDVSLDHVLTAVRVARRLGVPAWFLVADARFVPLLDASADVVFSYSVWQHFAKADTRLAIADAARVLRPGGRAIVQMANSFGVRNLYQQARRGFRAARDFEVRYWPPRELRSAFETAIGPAKITVDGFFSLNAQPTDRALLPRGARTVIAASELARRSSDVLTPLRWIADSLTITAVKRTTV